MSIHPTDFQAIASGIRRLCVAASTNINIDCFLHASLGYKILEEMDLKPEYRVGFAAWRVGSGDGDVISHIPQENAQLAPGAVPLHAWLELVDAVSGQPSIVDFTTYQLPAKASALDAMDGGSTSVDWAPDFLVVPIKSVSTYHDVAQGDAGLYFYDFKADITSKVRETVMKVDQGDLNNLRMLIANPDMRAFGPNHVGFKS